MTTKKPRNPEHVRAELDVTNLRSFGLCEYCGMPGATQFIRRRLNFAHRPDNLLHMCTTCRNLTQTRLATVRQRLEYDGVTVGRGARPNHVPFKHARLGWVELDPTGYIAPAQFSSAAKAQPTAWSFTLARRRCFCPCLSGQAERHHSPGWTFPIFECCVTCATQCSVRTPASLR